MSENSTTFCFNLEPTKQRPKEPATITVDKKFKGKCKLISKNSEIKYSHYCGSGLINAVVQAYNSHEHLELYPNETILDKPKSVCYTSIVNFGNSN